MARTMERHTTGSDLQRSNSIMARMASPGSVLSSVMIQFLYYQICYFKFCTINQVVQCQGRRSKISFVKVCAVPVPIITIGSYRQLPYTGIVIMYLEQ